MTERDERLLRQLGQRVRAERTDPDREALEALVRGELSDDELADLTARAAERPELEQALEVYTPLGTAVQERIAAQLQAASTARAAPRKELPAAARRPRVVRLWLAPGLAAAAAALFWINHTRPGEASEIPDYQLELLRVDNEYRSHSAGPSATDPIVLTSTVQWVCQLRPADAVRGPIAAKAFLARGQALEPWPAATRISARGAVRLELGPAPVRLGKHESARLILVVGTADSLDGIAARREGADRGLGWQRWSVPVIGAE